MELSLLFLTRSSGSTKYFSHWKFESRFMICTFNSNYERFQLRLIIKAIIRNYSLELQLNFAISARRVWNKKNETFYKEFDRDFNWNRFLCIVYNTVTISGGKIPFGFILKPNLNQHHFSISSIVSRANFNWTKHFLKRFS